MLAVLHFSLPATLPTQQRRGLFGTVTVHRASRVAGAKKAKELHEKQGQEIASFTTSRSTNTEGAVGKQTHQVRNCN